ncbi:MAG: hypothetical protein L6416_12920 [Candidatus Omnitrophica bacterium]|nr:hypothetical protein [Candidatus Omnitrophota bacterium]
MKKITIFVFSLLLFTLFSGRATFAQSAEFKPSYQINKAKATIHYFFSNFEKNPRLAKGIIAMLSEGGFELIYPWGDYKTKKDVDNWIKDIPDEFHDSHHIQGIKVEIIDDLSVTATADVIWQNSGPDNSHDRDHFSYVFELVDEGIGLLKIKSINCYRID